MTSIVNSSGVNLATPTGISGDVTVPDNASGTKIAAAVVDVNPADGSATQPAILAELATIASALTTTQVVALTTAQLAALTPLPAVSITGTAQVALTTSQIAALTPLSTVQIGNLPVTQQVALTTSQLAALTPLQTVAISNLSTQQLVALTTSQVAALQVADVSDGLGNPINSLTAGTGQNGLMVAIGATNYYASAANSSTAQLAAGATFAGAIENAYNEPAISVLLTSDQPGVLTINQYIDLAGTRLISSWPFTIAAGVPFSRAFTLNGNYVSVSFQNTGLSATTTYNQNVAYGTINAVTQQGNAPVSIFDSNGVQLGSDLYNGQAFLHVDTSHAATDGAAYNGVNVPQVGVMAGHGSDGNVHAITTDAAGNQNVNVLSLSDSGGLLDSIAQDMAASTINAGTPGAMVMPGELPDPSTNVALSVTVRDPIALDPTQPNVIGGVGPDGAPRRLVTGLDGGLRLSDAAVPYGWYAGATAGPGPIIDTTGYSSIVVSFSGANGSFYFQTSNDPEQFTASLANAAGWSAAGGQTPVTSVAAAAGANYVFPVTGRYFRLYCYTTGTAGMVTTYLRSAPAMADISTPSMNVAQISGTAAVTAAGVAGMMAVGGNIAAGTAATAGPVPVGGVDGGGLTRRILQDINGNQQIIGTLPVGYQVGIANYTYGGYTQTASTLTAAQSAVQPVLMGGTDMNGAIHRVSMDQFGNVLTEADVTKPDHMGQIDILHQLRALLFVQAQYMHALVSGQQVSVTDDPDTLLADALSPTGYLNYFTQ